MTEDERAELLRLCEAATPPPWKVLRKGHCVADFEAGVAACFMSARTLVEASANAAFIAAARSAVPALLAENARLRAIVDRFSKAMWCAGIAPEEDSNDPIAALLWDARTALAEGTGHE